MKISVVGMGRVGSATAFSLLVRAVPHELVLVGRTKDSTIGDAAFHKVKGELHYTQQNPSGTAHDKTIVAGMGRLDDSALIEVLRQGR